VMMALTISLPLRFQGRTLTERSIPFTSSDGVDLAVDRVLPPTPADDVETQTIGELRPTVFYLPPLNRTKNGWRSSSLETMCRMSGKQAFIVADYYGVGRSGGSFDDATLSRWISDSIEIAKNASPTKKVLLVGAGVGGWLALRIAAQEPDLVHGCITMGSGPDFTEELLWPALGESVKEEIDTEGSASIHWGRRDYTITKKFVDDAKNHLIFGSETDDSGHSVSLKCPVHILHCKDDEEVPFDTALRLARIVKAPRLDVKLIKKGGHTFDSEYGLQAMKNEVESALDYFDGNVDTWTAKHSAAVSW